MRDYCADHSLYAMTITQKIDDEKNRNAGILSGEQEPVVDSILSRDILLVCEAPRTAERLRREVSSNLYLNAEREAIDPRLFKIHIDFLVKKKLLRWKGRSRRGDDFYVTVSLPPKQEDETGLRLLRERWEGMARRAPPPPPPPPPPAPRAPRTLHVRQEEIQAEPRAELSPPPQPAPEPPAQEESVELPVAQDLESISEEVVAPELPTWSEETVARWTALRSLPEEEATRLLDRMEEEKSTPVQDPDPDAEAQQIEESFDRNAVLEKADVDAFNAEFARLRETHAPRRLPSASSLRGIAAAVSVLARGGALEGRDVCEVIRGLKAFV